MPSSHPVLLPDLPETTGFCCDCRNDIPAAYGRCYFCGLNRELLTTANAVAFVSLAVAGMPFARTIAAYKNRADARTRAFRATWLAALADTWLVRHEPCLAAAAGAGFSFDVVTVVPSRRGRPDGPLAQLARGLDVARDRYRDALIANNEQADPAHTPAPNLFTPTADVTGSRVLLIEDLWATGSNAQSAASALKQAGASRVGILAFGRHCRRPSESGGVLCRRLLERSRATGWSATACRYCAVAEPAETAA